MLFPLCKKGGRPLLPSSARLKLVATNVPQAIRLKCLRVAHDVGVRPATIYRRAINHVMGSPKILRQLFPVEGEKV